jgi:hypothetical protein
MLNDEKVGQVRLELYRLFDSYESVTFRGLPEPNMQHVLKALWHGWFGPSISKIRRVVVKALADEYAPIVVELEPHLEPKTIAAGLLNAAFKAMLIRLASGKDGPPNPQFAGVAVVTRFKGEPTEFSWAYPGGVEFLVDPRMAAAAAGPQKGGEANA